MEALREITNWKYNHTYLVDGNRVLAYIPQGSDVPEYCKNSLRFDRRGRKFEKVSLSLFPRREVDTRIQVLGSRGTAYWVSPEERTCTCPGFSFRGHCRHLEAA